MQYLKISYDVLWDLPIFKRRFFLYEKIAENNKRREMVEEQQQTSGTKGERTRRVTGNALKSGLQSGEISI